MLIDLTKSVRPDRFDHSHVPQFDTPLGWFTNSVLGSRVDRHCCVGRPRVAVHRVDGWRSVRPPRRVHRKLPRHVAAHGGLRRRVPAPQVLDERVTAGHRRRRPISSKTAHRQQSRCEPSVIAFDPVVRVLGRVMKNAGEKVVDNAWQWCGQICGDLTSSGAARKHHLEEPDGSCDVASFRDEHIDDLAVLVHRPAHVPPHTGNSDVGLVHEPAIADTVPTRARRLDDQRGEALHPTVDGAVIDVHATLSEELFDIGVRESVAEVPAHRRQDHVRWEPEARGRQIPRVATATTNHPGTLRPAPDPSTQQRRRSCVRRRTTSSTSCWVTALDRERYEPWTRRPTALQQRMALLR